MTLLALRIGNDVSYVTQITDEIHFVWQAQYLVQLEVTFRGRRSTSSHFGR